MKNDELNPGEKRICIFCQRQLDEDSHGNCKAHKSCAYRNKKLRQKEKYKIGNPAKLLIQKNETVAAQLYEMDQQKHGIPHLTAMELGFKFECPSIKREYMDTVIYMLDKYGYSFETIDVEILIHFYHESDLK
ncbi:MAG TPA: hypothetical protein VMV47_04950 [Bacteroidales bacterium]|nr:hypothetical protein [Bacteroidales bacterium]